MPFSMERTRSCSRQRQRLGDYPVEAVTLMDRIVRQAEDGFEAWGHNQEIESNEHDDAVAVTRAARELAHDQDVAAVAVFTRLGRSALLMAKARPRVPILAFTSEVRTYRRLALAWGVQPHIVPFVDTVEEMFHCVETALREFWNGEARTADGACMRFSHFRDATTEHGAATYFSVKNFEYSFPPGT